MEISMMGKTLLLKFEGWHSSLEGEKHDKI